MAGPKIMWDAHNYLALDLCTGRSWEDESPDLTEEEYERLGGVVKDMDTGVTVEWDEDPLEFAKNLEEAAAKLRAIVAAVGASGFPADHFHFRTDID